MFGMAGNDANIGADLKWACKLQSVPVVKTIAFGSLPATLMYNHQCTSL